VFHQQQYNSIIQRPAAERMPTDTSCSPHACRVFTWVIISPSSMPVKPSMANLQQHQRRQCVTSVPCRLLTKRWLQAHPASCHTSNSDCLA
jgi:hypothetical protein